MHGGKQAGLPQWAYLAAGAPLVLLLGACIWAARFDLDNVRTALLQSEIHQLRAQTVRRAGRLEFLIERHDAAAKPWRELREQPWLMGFWGGVELAPHQLYAAVVDTTGTIVMHHDPARVGQRRGRGWYDRRVSEAGDDVVRATKGPLVGEAEVFDVSVPLTVADEWIGDFHEGLDASWLDRAVAAEERRVYRKWCWLILGAIGVDIVAVGALIYLARGQQSLMQSMQVSAKHRARELAQLGSGLAHEIRNPLHALRINLHLLRRAMAGRAPAADDQVVATIHDSEAAIERLGGLMNDLMQFSDPHSGTPAEIDLGREVEATLNLMSEDLRRNQVEVTATLPSEPVQVWIDPTRLRQLIQNLLTFARHKSGKRGTIEVEVKSSGEEAELIVADSGPGLSDEKQAHVFEPFQAPAETGSGMGLALVQTYVEEAGGRVECQRRSPVGNQLRLWLPLVHTTPPGGKA
jgi:signal transduction histidine kinase